MTKRKAKSLSLKVWRYLRDHPQFAMKTDLPKELLKEIEEMECYCPLCEYQIQKKRVKLKWFDDKRQYGEDGRCGGCPLCVNHQCCADGDQPYNMWCYYDDTDSKNSMKMRDKYAGLVVKQIEAWEVK